jgi:hypothetical protein
MVSPLFSEINSYLDSLQPPFPHELSLVDSLAQAALEAEIELKSRQGKAQRPHVIACGHCRRVSGYSALACRGPTNKRAIVKRDRMLKTNQVDDLTAP